MSMHIPFGQQREGKRPHFLLFCSFGMAYEFIDCIGDDVDVVSDSEVCGSLSKLENVQVYSGWGGNICFLSHSEHQEALEDSLQQIPRQYGCSPRGEDVAFG